MSWKTLEKSGLEPTASNRLADRKHCALSTQPKMGDLAESINRSASDRSARRFDAVFYFFLLLYLRIPQQGRTLIEGVSIERL